MLDRLKGLTRLQTFCQFQLLFFLIPVAFEYCYINWIEQLIQTPLPEHRKFVVWMILPQYLINIRKMTYEQSNTIINNWLHECNILRRLDSASIKQKLKEGFEAAQKGFGPIGRDKLRVWKPELVDILFTDTASS